jgi:hypothetical protein
MLHGDRSNLWMEEARSQKYPYISIRKSDVTNSRDSVACMVTRLRNVEPRSRSNPGRENVFSPSKSLDVLWGH